MIATFKRVWYYTKRIFTKPPVLGTHAASFQPDVSQPQEGTSMQFAKISHAQATSLRLARAHASDADRKGVKKELYPSIKATFGIPPKTRIKVEVDPHRADYAVIKDAKTDAKFELNSSGMWNGTTQAARVDVPSSWFKLPADKLKQALIDAIESVLAGDAECFDKDDLPGDAIKLRDGALDVALDAEGNAYVYLPDDQFEQATGGDD